MEFKEQLRAQVDIVRVASDYVRLRRIGKRYSGLCPFHNEKTPSFSINQEHLFWVRRERRRLQVRGDDRGPHVLGGAEETRRPAWHRAPQTVVFERRRDP